MQYVQYLPFNLVPTSHKNIAEKGFGFYRSKRKKMYYPRLEQKLMELSIYILWIDYLFKTPPLWHTVTRRGRAIHNTGTTKHRIICQQLYETRLFRTQPEPSQRITSHWVITSQLTPRQKGAFYMQHPSDGMTCLGSIR